MSWTYLKRPKCCSRPLQPQECFQELDRLSGLQTYIYMMLLHRLEMHILVMLEAFPLFLYWTLLCSFCFSNEKMLTEECEVNVTLGLRYLLASMSIEKGRHSRFIRICFYHMMPLLLNWVLDKAFISISNMELYF